MSVGKYSPTVSTSYSLDQTWWERNGGGFGNGKNPNSENDDDGFDSYGYADGDGDDRAGYSEMEYLTSSSYDEDTGICYYDLYDQISGEWRGKRLGDLDDYVTSSEIVKLTGYRASDLHPLFVLANARVLMDKHSLGYNFLVHKDDVDATVNSLKKKVK